MSLFSGLVRRDSTPPERRMITELAGIPSNSESGGVGIGGGDLHALQSIAVLACVRLLADSIAGLPLAAYKNDGDLRQRLTPQPSLIQQPFDGLTNFEGMFQTCMALAMRGEVLLLVIHRNSLEFPTFLRPIHPDNWSVKKDRKDGSVQYSVYGEPVSSADVVHIKRISLPEQLHGISPVNMARIGIGVGLAAENYGARFFADSANPSSILKTDQNLDPEDVLKAQKAWKASNGGRRHPAVLTGGFDWKPISITPEESQFLETRRFQRSEIAMLFGVPPHMIGDVSGSTSWGTGIEQQSIGFVTYTLRPWLTCIETAFSALLPSKQYVKFNVAGLLRGDTPSRYNAYTQARNAGWLNVDEIRALEDRAPVPNGAGQSYIQPLNMGPLGFDPKGEDQ